MGKNSKAGKKKNTNKATIAGTERAIKKQVQDMKKEISTAIWDDYERVMYPIAEETAFLYLIYLSLMTLSGRFGFGKQRLTRFADDVINQYECVVGKWVTLQDMSDYIYNMTGLRFEPSDEQLKRQVFKKMGIQEDAV